MIHLRQWSALALLGLLTVLLATVPGQQQPPKEKRPDAKPADKWLVDRTLTVTAAAAPVPALRDRLFPMNSERKEGNAVPIYLRFAHERGDARKKELREKPAEWNKLPLDKLPLAEAKAFLKSYKYNLGQFDLAARRKTADWNYTLDTGDLIGILLPDVAEMRMQAPLLVLQTRVEIAEGRYQDAIRTLETGFSFSQQISEAPFLVNGLVGIACASLFTDCLLELIQRPDAPNLYWALTVLPRPLFDLRRPYDFEHNLLEMQFPYLADLNRPRSTAEWDAVLKRIRTEIQSFSKVDPNLKPPKPGNAPTDPASKSPDLPIARKYLTEVVKMPAARVEAMPPAEVLLRYLTNYYHEIRDEVFKVTYLPFHQGRSLTALAEKRLKSAPATQAAELAQLFLPAIPKVRLAEVRIDRKLAALRAIEALRMHAAANNGQLPEKLEQVTIVPVPADPGTGLPFEYKRQGQTAILSSRISGEPLNTTGLRYRLTLRK